MLSRKRKVKSDEPIDLAHDFFERLTSTDTARTKDSSAQSKRQRDEVDGDLDLSLTPPSYTLTAEQLAALPPDSDEIFTHFIPQTVQRHTVTLTDDTSNRSCVCEVAYPIGWNVDVSGSASDIVLPSNFAESDQSVVDIIKSATAQSTGGPLTVEARVYRTFPFRLDPFQSESIAALHRNQSVLVSAHTSAGKTVIAEYAIAMALYHHQRVIYTSPIKALSNQKYRELQSAFTDVGLLTGDVTINPTASCLVMTTEILRNMLYRGSEVVREVATIIYDEIHYMRNKERGVVWEETIVMLPHSTRFVFLSATIPNATEFALWIAKVHHQPCNVVYTDYRPTPLQHYLFPAGADGLYLCVDERGNFREDNFQKALAVLNQSSSSNDTTNDGGHVDGDKPGKDQRKKRRSGGNSKGSASDIYKIVRMIMERHYSPVIVFSFSKRECETHALAMSSLDMSTDDEKSLIKQIYRNAIASLAADDQQLPQVLNLLPLLTRGIGIHHSGLLPILKEVIEILFQEGLVKCLFSTETFSMGLNMPAKTVVFTSVHKFDGVQMRVISGGEYIQMSGRAGRRGLDERGIVICMMDQSMDPVTAKSMMKGISDTLISSFHLSYNMLLNLLRVEDYSAIRMMIRSFHQFQQTRKAPALYEQIQKAEEEMTRLRESARHYEVAVAYRKLKFELEHHMTVLRHKWSQPAHLLRFMNGGRLIHVCSRKSDDSVDVDWGWGVIVQYFKKNASKEAITSTDDLYDIAVLLHATGRTHLSKKRALSESTPYRAGQQAGEWITFNVRCSQVTALSSVVLKISDFRTFESRSKAGMSIDEVRKRLDGTIPLLDPIKDMHIDDAETKQTVADIEDLKEKVAKHEFAKLSTDEADADIEICTEIERMKADLVERRQRLSDITNDVAMLSTMKHMHAVLQRLGHINAESVIQVKGRVAAEMSTADELLCAELMFDGAFTSLSTPILVALCSCLVCNERNNDESPLPNDLNHHYKALQSSARRISGVMIECGMTVDTDEYLNSFQPTIMLVVHQWCRGVKFAEICKMTDVFEGTIIRLMRRLEELLRQFAVASKSVGNTQLEEKFTAGIQLLKRDIVFAASLYL